MIDQVMLSRPFQDVKHRVFLLAFWHVPTQLLIEFHDSLVHVIALAKHGNQVLGNKAGQLCRFEPLSNRLVDDGARVYLFKFPAPGWMLVCGLHRDYPPRIDRAASPYAYVLRG